MRRLRGFLLVLVLAGVLFPATGAGLARATDGTTPVDGGTAEDAARQIAAARERANAAADDWAEAESKLDLLADEKDKLDKEVVDLQKQVDELQKVVEAVAVNRYIGVGTTGIPLLAGNTGPTEQAQTALLVGIVNEASAGSFDQYKLLMKQLDDKKAEADATTNDWLAAQKDFEAKQQTALDEVERLKLVEKDRLTDEAVVRALEARRQKDLEAVQKAAAEQLKKDQAIAEAAEGGGSDGGDEGQGAVTGNVESVSSSGGTTGGGGSGARPGGDLGSVFGSGDSWDCPVVGTWPFADTWGAPRSGGRLHQGVDIIASMHTEIVAVVDGVAVAKTNTLGGNTISLTGNDGNRYYYAHLESWATLGPVTKGTVIGYVGQTGNAIFSVPHLHFEIHPGGGPAVNPTPTVRANC